MKPTGGWLIWAASALAAAFVALALILLGSPWWAVYGFSFLAFLVWRLGDRAVPR